jgi:hypothetical protein
MLEYFAYRLHDRPGDFNTPLKCKRGTQAYEVDGCCCVEGERLGHYRKPSFQKKYRSAPYNSLTQASLLDLQPANVLSYLPHLLEALGIYISKLSRLYCYLQKIWMPRFVHHLHIKSSLA